MPQDIYQQFWWTLTAGGPAVGEVYQIHRLLAWLREQPSAAYSDWHGLPPEGPQNKFYAPLTSLLQVLAAYRSNNYEVDLDDYLAPATLGPPSWSGWAAVTPQVAFDSNELATLTFVADDVKFFPAIQLVLQDYVKAWLESDTRAVTVSLTRVDSGNWSLEVTIAADSGSRWTGAYTNSFTRAFASAPAIADVPINFSSERYDATFQDAAGKDLDVSFRTATRTEAFAIANAIAAQSDAQWTALRSVRNLLIPSTNSHGDPIYTHFASTPLSTSDIQRKGRAVYRTAIAGNVITVEIPSVVSSLVSRDNETSSSDPLGSDQRAMLLSENGAPAVALNQVRFGYRISK